MATLSSPELFEPKQEDVIDDWRQLRNEELRDLHSSSNVAMVIKLRKMSQAGHFTSMGENRNAHRFLVENLEGNGPLWRLRRRWEDAGICILKKLHGRDMNWIDLAQDKGKGQAFVNTVMSFWFHKISRISWPAEEPSVSHVRLCFVELISQLVNQSVIWLVVWLACLVGCFVSFVCLFVRYLSS